MRITEVLGSPRKNGFSSRLADALADRKPEVARFVLNDLKNVRGCQACMACKAKVERCVIEDDLTAVLASAAESDLILLASPIYMGDISAQMKLFIDRTFSWIPPDYRKNPAAIRVGPGKTLAVILAQGHPDVDAFNGVLDDYIKFFAARGLAAKRLVFAPLPAGGDPDQESAAIKKSAALLAGRL